MKKIYATLILALVIGNVKSQIINGNYLDINNVKVQVGADGSLFNYGNLTSEVPIGSGKTTLFGSSLWIGGYDTGGQLKISAQTYHQTGGDFYPGPIDPTSTYNTAYDQKWNRVWKIRQCDISKLFTWGIGGIPGPNPLDSEAMEVVNNWPAFDLLGHPLAPFYDYNGDGVYDPTIGDLPSIKGDEAILFVYNDVRGPRAPSGGTPINVEIAGMVYGYSCTNDSALFNTVFTNYKIIYSDTTTTNDSVFIGNWTDFDIGNYADDYIACDVSRGTYYGFNANAMDGNGLGNTYGANPPAEGVVFLNGPLKDPNGVDDASNSTPNGTGYGDLIIDNERLGMSRFMEFQNNTSPINGYPTSANHYYQYLAGAWKSGVHWAYGGNGANGSVNCDYMFPGNSDPLFFGTHGVAEPSWDEFSAGLPPHDVNGVGAYGPFKLLPYQTQTIDFAYVYGRATTGRNLTSIAVLNNRIDSVRSKFYTGEIGRNWAPTTPSFHCGCGSSTAINEINVNNNILIAPNPTSGVFQISDSKFQVKSIKVMNILGETIYQSQINNQQSTIDLRGVDKGIYFVQVTDEKNIIYNKKIIVQ